MQAGRSARLIRKRGSGQARFIDVELQIEPRQLQPKAIQSRGS